MDLHRALQLGYVVFVFACCQLCAAQLTIQRGSGTQTAILQRGSGRTDFVIENTGDTALPLSLSAGVATDDISRVGMTGAKITLGLEPGTQTLPQTVAPHTTLEIAVEISNLTASTAVQIPIFNGNVKLGEVEAVTSDAPINVSLDGPGSSGTLLVFARGKNASITLKNGDPITYPVRWSFQVGGMSKSDKLILPANGTATIVLTPQKSAYSLSNFIRPSSRTARLLLSLDVPAVRAIEPQTTHAVSVNLTMQPLGRGLTTIFSDIYVVFFLLIGGCTSVLASSVLPNMLRKSSLGGQINDLADRTSSVSTRVDSYLRVLLRLERKKIDILLRSSMLYSLSVSDSLDDVSSDIDRLAKRLAVAERLDDLRSRLEGTSATAPPSVVGDVNAKLQASADQMHSFALPDENVTTANRFLDDASASLA